MASLLILAGEVKDQGYKLKDGKPVGSTVVDDYERVSPVTKNQVTVVTFNTSKSGGSLWVATEGPAATVPVIVRYFDTAWHSVVLLARSGAPGATNRAGLPSGITKVSVARADASDQAVGWNLQTAV